MDTDVGEHVSVGAADAADESGRMQAAQVSDRMTAERGLDGPASFARADGSTPTVRVMILDMIEEYARHTGHADILREAVDGLVCEGARHRTSKDNDPIVRPMPRCSRSTLPPAPEGREIR